MEEITLDKIRKTFEEMFSEEELRPYKDLGNGLYELPGCVICNKKGLDEYLGVLKDTYMKTTEENNPYK